MEQRLEHVLLDPTGIALSWSCSAMGACVRGDGTPACVDFARGDVVRKLRASRRASRSAASGSRARGLQLEAALEGQPSFALTQPSAARWGRRPAPALPASASGRVRAVVTLVAGHDVVRKRSVRLVPGSHRSSRVRAATARERGRRREGATSSGVRGVARIFGRANELLRAAAHWGRRPIKCDRWRILTATTRPAFFAFT